MKKRILQQLTTIIVTSIVFIFMYLNLIPLIAGFSIIILCIFVLNPHTTSSKLSCSIQSTQIDEIKSLASKIMHENKMTSRKLEIFELLAITSKEFLCSINPNSGKVERLLSGIVKSLNVTRGYMFKFNKHTKLFELRYITGLDKTNFCFNNVNELEFTKIFSTLRSNKNIVGFDDISNEYHYIFDNCNTQTFLWLPIHVDGRFTGFMGFDSSRNKTWNKTEIDMLIVVIEIFAAWCSRMHAEKLK